MNDSPWRVASVARIQRERIQEEMWQIRREERALRAQVRRPGPLAWFWARVQHWMGRRQQPPVSVYHRRLLTAAPARRQPRG